MYAKIGATQVPVATYPSRGSRPPTAVMVADCQEVLFFLFVPPPFSKTVSPKIDGSVLVSTVKQVRR